MFLGTYAVDPGGFELNSADIWVGRSQEGGVPGTAGGGQPPWAPPTGC